MFDKDSIPRTTLHCLGCARFDTSMLDLVNQCRRVRHGSSPVATQDLTHHSMSVGAFVDIYRKVEMLNISSYTYMTKLWSELSSSDVQLRSDAFWWLETVGDLLCIPSHGLMEGTRSIKDTIAEMDRIISLCNEFVYLFLLSCWWFLGLCLWRCLCSVPFFTFWLRIQQSILP